MFLNLVKLLMAETENFIKAFTDDAHMINIRHGSVWTFILTPHVENQSVKSELIFDQSLQLQ